MTQVALVTGSVRGLGFSTVKQLLRQNPTWTVYLTGRDEKRGLEAVEALKKEIGLKAQFHQLDIDSIDSIKKLAEFIKAKHPDGLNVLVNNAGIMPQIAKPSEDGKSCTFDDVAARQTVTTNYYGCRNTLEHLFPLVNKTNGRVVNVSSGLGQSFFFKCTDAVKQRFLTAKTIAELDKLSEDFMKVPVGELVTAGWLTVDPAAPFHSGFRLADVFPIGFGHLQIALLTEVYQRRAVEEGSKVVVTSVCPGRVKSDMNPTGLHTPDEASLFVMAGVNLSPDTELKGYFISQGTPFEHWSKVVMNTGEVKRD